MVSLVPHADRFHEPQRHADQFASLQAENKRLQEALAATERSVASKTTSSSDNLTADNRSLREELARNDRLLGELWNTLPDPEIRRHVGPIDVQTGKFDNQLASPRAEINFDALRAIYSPSTDRREQHQGLEKVLERVKMLIADGQLLTERVMRASGERNLWKDNATKAKKLAEDSSSHLQTYQR